MQKTSPLTSEAPREPRKKHEYTDNICKHCGTIRQEKWVKWNDQHHIKTYEYIDPNTGEITSRANNCKTNQYILNL